MVKHIVFCRLANSGESIQHVGYSERGINMKPCRASVHQEARLNQQQLHCANQFKLSDVMNMSASTLARSRFQRRGPNRVQSQSSKSVFSAKTISTMLHLLYISALFLVFTPNALRFAVAENGGKNGVNAASDADSNVPTTTEFGEF